MTTSCTIVPKFLLTLRPNNKAKSVLMKKILITGASGFIGSFIVEEALKRGFETWAAVRKSSSKKYLTDSRIHFIELDLGNRDKLEQQLSGHQFDYVVHAAGVTKCLHSSDFFKVNTEGTVNLATALRRQNAGLRRFVYLSSLSVMGPAREQEPHTEITADDAPRHGLRQEQAGERAAAGRYKGLPVYSAAPHGRLRSARKRLLHDGAEHQAARRLCRRIPTAAHHVHIRDGCGAGSVPCPRPRHRWREVFYQRRQGLLVAHVQRPDTQGAWQPVAVAHKGSAMGAAHRDIAWRMGRPHYRQDFCP